MSPIYLIPKSHAKLKPYALVFFSLDNREGAQEEAQEVIRLSKSDEHNCHQHRMEKDLNQLKTFLEERLLDIKDECSLLMVCVMAHGYKGYMVGSYTGSQGQINHVFAVFDKIPVLPNYVPLVSL